jgi:hypothetical protein
MLFVRLRGRGRRWRRLVSHLCGVDVCATHEHHVLLAVSQMAVALLVNQPHISAGLPSVLVGLPQRQRGNTMKPGFRRCRATEDKNSGSAAVYGDGSASHTFDTAPRYVYVTRCSWWRIQTSPIVPGGTGWCVSGSTILMWPAAGRPTQLRPFCFGTASHSSPCTGFR